MHDSDVWLPLHCLGNDGVEFWYWFGALCAWSDSKPCKSRPSESI